MPGLPSGPHRTTISLEPTNKPFTSRNLFRGCRPLEYMFFRLTITRVAISGRRRRDLTFIGQSSYTSLKLVHNGSHLPCVHLRQPHTHSYWIPTDTDTAWTCHVPCPSDPIIPVRT